MKIIGWKLNRQLILRCLPGLLALVLCLIAGGSRIQAQTPDPAIRMETNPLSGAVGETFATRFFADHIPPPGLSDWQISIEYDPIIVEKTDLIFGKDLFSTGREKLLELVNDDTPGRVLFGQITLTGPDGPTGSGLHLATIVWRGVGLGTSPLTLTPVNTQKLVAINNVPLTPITLDVSSIKIVGAVALEKAVWLPLLLRLE